MPIHHWVKVVQILSAEYNYEYQHRVNLAREKNWFSFDSYISSFGLTMIGDGYVCILTSIVTCA